MAHIFPASRACCPTTSKHTSARPQRNMYMAWMQVYVSHPSDRIRSMLTAHRGEVDNQPPRCGRVGRAGARLRVPLRYVHPPYRPPRGRIGRADALLAFGATPEVLTRRAPLSGHSSTRTLTCLWSMLYLIPSLVQNLAADEQLLRVVAHGPLDDAPNLLALGQPNGLSLGNRRRGRVPRLHRPVHGLGQLACRTASMRPGRRPRAVVPR